MGTLNVVSSHLKCQSFVANSVSQPHQGGIHEVQQGHKRYQIDRNVGDQFDRHGRAVRGSFDKIAFLPAES